MITNNLNLIEIFLLGLAALLVVVKFAFSFIGEKSKRETLYSTFFKWYNKMHIYTYHDNEKRQLFMYASNIINLLFWTSFGFVGFIFLYQLIYVLTE